MSSTREAVAFSLGVVFLAALLCHCSLGCRPPAPPVPGYCITEQAYLGALIDCVDNAATIAESRACRREVNRACGISETVARGHE